MDTIPSNIPRFHASLSGVRIQSGTPVTSVTQRLRFPRPSATLQTARTFSIAKEPEDARLTGGTRSLDRRLLALNLVPLEKVKPVRSVPAPGRMAAPMHPTAA